MKKNPCLNNDDTIPIKLDSQSGPANYLKALTPAFGKHTLLKNQQRPCHVRVLSFELPSSYLAIKP